MYLACVVMDPEGGRERPEQSTDILRSDPVYSRFGHSDEQIYPMEHGVMQSRYTLHLQWSVPPYAIDGRWSIQFYSTTTSRPQVSINREVRKTVSILAVTPYIYTDP